MKTLKYLLRKEFKQIFRNKSILPLIFAVPIVQLMILPLAADYEIKNINIAIVDNDHSSYSRKLISKIESSGYFRIAGYDNSFRRAFGLIENDEADLVLEIPDGFESNLVRENKEKLFVAINAINGAKASVGGTYLGRIINDYNNDIRVDWSAPERFRPVPSIEVSSLNWFNPFLSYQTFMVPGILAVLVTMIGSYMCALNIVKEKEVGTIEQINVTPIRKFHFVLGKLIPFWLIGMFVFTVGLFLVARLIYGIVLAGSIALLYSFLGVYLIAVLGIGLLISTYANTQQQAMSLAFFFMVIFMLMGGLFTPVDSMPEWAKWIARLNPVTYFIEVVRMVVMKGSDFNDIKRHFLIVAGFGVFFNGWAILNYKKTS